MTAASTIQSDDPNWARIKLDYENALVIPARFLPQLVEMLTYAKVIKEGYSSKDGPVMQTYVPGFDFVTNGYVAGAAARAKMLAEKEE